MNSQKDSTRSVPLHGTRPGGLPLDVKERVKKEAALCVGLGLVFMVPALVTLLAVNSPRPFAFTDDVAPNPTPWGYTISLGLFILPTFIFGGWLLRNSHCPVERRAWACTLGLLVPLGLILDIAFGGLFLKFENTGAVAGLYLPGWSFSKAGFELTIPIEEFVFYVFGFTTVLSVYIWASEFWLKAYQIPDAMRAPKYVFQRVSFQPQLALWGAVLFGLAWLFKKYGPHAFQEGFPGYFLFLLASSVVPTILLFGIAVGYVNWRAFSLAFFFTLAVSQFWEATLGVPYKWWGYESSQMLGLMINPFSELPIEAALVWVAVTWTTIIIYETIHTLLHLEPEDRLRVFDLMKTEAIRMVRRRRGE